MEPSGGRSDLPVEPASRPARVSSAALGGFGVGCEGDEVSGYGGWLGQCRRSVRWRRARAGVPARRSGSGKDLQAKVKSMMQDGVRVHACVVCADSYGVSTRLREPGLEVKGMGPHGAAADGHAQTRLEGNHALTLAVPERECRESCEHRLVSVPLLPSLYAIGRKVRCEPGHLVSEGDSVLDHPVGGQREKRA